MQLWIGLFTGFILGWILEWIIDWLFWRLPSQHTPSSPGQLQNELTSARLQIADLQEQLSAAPPVTQSLVAPEPTEQDTAELEEKQNLLDEANRLNNQITVQLAEAESKTDILHAQLKSQAEISDATIAGLQQEISNQS